MPPAVPRRLRSQRGIALVATTLLLLIMLCVGSAMLLYTAYELQTSAHYNSGNQALYAAEAGVLHGINVINRASASNLSTDVVQKWGALFSPATQSVPGYPQFQYTLTATADATNPGTRAWLTSVGGAPNGARRIIRVGVRLAGGTGGLGSIYLANDLLNPSFTGNAFDIDGNDHTPNGVAVPNGASTPGIGTHADVGVQKLTGALSNQQKDNVVGLGFSASPLTASTINTSGPDLTALTNLADAFRSDPRAAFINGNVFKGNQALGNLANPQLTIVNPIDVKIEGNVSGAGVLIVNGQLTINGNFNFVGWVLSIGIAGTTINGNTTITGSYWSAAKDFQLKGSDSFLYCSACTKLMGDPPAGGGGGFGPGPVTIAAWQEIQ